jgi:outer membrane protein assembly factor BamD (BamD/ComL family)
MKRYLLTIYLAMAMGGCATMTKPGGILYRTAQENKLARATKLMGERKSATAAELLASVCSEPGIEGVTDEALFRLGVLRLESNQEKQAQHDLERLKKEYPKSPWAPMAASLTEFLSSTDDMRQQGRRLKEQNLSLTKENKELHQSIDQLKSLELELGRGSKH